MACTSWAKTDSQAFGRRTALVAPPASHCAPGGGMRPYGPAAEASGSTFTPRGGMGDAEEGGETSIVPTEPALRIIMRRRREIMGEPSDGQSRLHKIVRQIAGLMVAEACLDLSQAPGRHARAVRHRRTETRRGPQHLHKRGEGLVGRRAELPRPSTSRTRRTILRSPTGRRRARRSTILPGGADPARRRRAGRAHRAEQDAEGIFRRGRRGAADHRHGAGRAPGVGGGRRRNTGPSSAAPSAM